MCRKSCLDCVFCLRHKDYWISFLHSPNNSYWRNEEYNLTKKEISELKKGTASFLSEDKRMYDKWLEEYEKKKRKQIKRNSIEGYQKRKNLTISVRSL